VIQPLEWYRTQRDPDRLVPIFYNLGNLVAIANAPFSALSLIASLKLVKGQVGNETKTLVESLSVVPVLQMNRESNGASQVWLETVQQLWANRTGSRDRCRIEEAAKYADLVLGPGWRESAI
jgi:poly-gamma-glutamate synthesis protein (capsule biosynthesis protein)